MFLLIIIKLEDCRYFVKESKLRLMINNTNISNVMYLNIYIIYLAEHI